MKEGFSRFDAAEYLESEEDVLAYLEAATEDGDPNAIAVALGTIARARNISQLARDTGMTRTGLYKALAAGGNPSFETVVKVAKALGFGLTLTPKVDKTSTVKRAIRKRKQAA